MEAFARKSYSIIINSDIIKLSTYFTRGDNGNFISYIKGQLIKSRGI
jgi:hypothetical protein